MTVAITDPSPPAPPAPRPAALTAVARAWLIVIALVLIVPTAAMRLQTDDELEAFHNRVLATWPAARDFKHDPAGWFAAANRWLADRAYPIVAATHLANNLAYFVLDTSPKANISVARHGLVFLNGSDPSAPNNLVESACVDPLDPAFQARLRAAIVRIGSFGRRRGLPIDVVVVPTVPTLYPDRLPRAIPSGLRHACLRAAGGASPFFHLLPQAGTTSVYTYAAMKARGDDPALYPNGNFHPDGLSLKLVRDAYLDEIGAARPSGETVTLTTGPSELLGSHGIVADFPIHDVSAAAGAATIDAPAAGAIEAATARFYDDPQTVFAFRNERSPNPSAILMLSDSFGEKESFSFSAAFREVVRLRAPDGDPSGVLDAVAAVTGVDRLVLLFNDGNTDLLIRLAEALPIEAVPSNTR